MGAKHWSRGVYILCWKDRQGRKRMSWDKNAEQLCLYAAALNWEGADAVVYDGFKKTVSLGQVPKDAKAKGTKKKSAKKKPKTAKAAVVGATVSGPVLG